MAPNVPPQQCNCAVIMASQAPDPFIFNCTEEILVSGKALPKGKTENSPSPGKCCSEVSFSLGLKNGSSSKIHGMGSNVSQKLFQAQPQIWFHSSNAPLAAKSKLCHCSAIPVWKQIFLVKISPVNGIPTSHQSQHPAQMKVIPWICLQQSNPLILLLLWLFLKGKFLHMNHYIEPFCLPACYWTIQETAFKCKKAKQQYWLSFVWVYLIL